MNILVVGAGVMGYNHIRTYSHLPQVTKVIVIEPFEQNAKRVKDANFEKVEIYSDLKEVNLKDVNAASITVPTHLHYEVAMQLIQAKIPLLIEKPIAPSVKEGQELVLKAKENKVLLTVGHIERFNPAVQALKKNIGMLGDVFYASAHRFGVPTTRNLGKSFVDQAVHDIDVISYLTGKAPTAISAVERKILDGSSEDLCSAVVEYGEFCATIEANRVTPIKNRDLTILGTKGMAKLDYITQDLVIVTSDNTMNKYSTFDEVVMRVGKGAEFKPYFAKEEPLKLELVHFLDCVKNKKQPVVTGEDSIIAVAAVDAGVKSAKSGKKEKIKV